MIHHGDCLDVLPTLDAESIDAIVTDPPYLIGFMGKRWDGPASFVERKSVRRAGTFESAHGNHNPTDAADAARTRRSENARAQEWHYRWAVEAFRVAKPGAHLLAFGGTRTYHRLACAVEDAGWEVRDCLVWAYASGFPKSLDVSKAIDKAAGAEREVVGKKHVTNAAQGKGLGHGDLVSGTVVAGLIDVTAPATPEAAKWQGWGTALKPAWEPIILARKPLRGTVARNVQEYGTGALNIDGCRIVTGDDTTTRHSSSSSYLTGQIGEVQPKQEPYVTGGTSGRWPANIVLTDPIFDGDTPGVVGGGEEYSRYFVLPKADRSDREPVLGGLPERFAATLSGGERIPMTEQNGTAPRNDAKRANIHPTVKPTDLMRHLVRLVTPPGGVVLDPFLGSGTTALAAEMEGFGWVGIEREEEYVRIAEARLNGTQKGMAL